MIKESQHNILVIVNTHIVSGKFYLEKIIHVKNKKLIRKQKSSKTEKTILLFRETGGTIIFK